MSDNDIMNLARMGLSPTEIAEELEVSRTLVAVRLFRARGRGEAVPKFSRGYLSLTLDEQHELEKEAAFWGVPPRWLARIIVGAVCRERLVTAVIGKSPKKIFNEGRGVQNEDS